jgi:hypothetical protein
VLARAEAERIERGDYDWEPGEANELSFWPSEKARTTEYLNLATSAVGWLVP